MADIRLAWDLDERQLLEGLQKVENRLEEIEKELGKVDKSSDKAFRDGAKKTTRFERAVNRLKKPFQNITKQINSVAGLVGVAFSVGAVVAFGRAAVRAFDQQEKAVTKVRQALVSTGNASQLTLKQLTDEASRLQSETIFGDEQILEGATAQLLTFTNIAGDNFLRTQQVALDLSTVLGTDLQSSAIQLGKALNDPVANLSALSRSGIQFSDSQKEVIKELANTNRLAEAQVVILEELERQYGGQARAAVTGAGRITQFTNAVGDLFEVIGGRIISIIEPVAAATQGIVETLTNLIGVQEDEVDQLRNQNLEFNTQIRVLQDGNITQEQRRELINRINKEYKDYLPNLLTEKSSIEDITTAQNLANDAFAQRILLTQFEEELNKIAEARLAANKANLETQKEAAKQYEIEQKAIDDLGGSYGAYTKGLDDGIASFDIANISAQENIKTNQELDTQAKELEETYEELAKTLGTTLAEIQARFRLASNAAQGTGDAANQTKKSFEEMLLSLAQFGEGLELETIFQSGFLGRDFIITERDLTLKEFDKLVEAIEAQAAAAGKTLPAAWKKSIDAARQEIIDQTDRVLNRVVDPVETLPTLRPPGVTISPTVQREIDKENKEAVEKIADGLSDEINENYGKLEDRIKQFSFGGLVQKLFKLDDSETQFVEEQANQFFQSTLQALDFGTELQIIQQDRLIEKLDERIAKQQELVDKEAKLAAEGFANNLNLEKEQLAAIEEERKKATERKLRLQREAAKRELAVQQALQVANLTSAAIEVFGSGAKFGLPGILFAASAVATLFSLVAQAKAQAAQFATPDELRGGGLFDGPNLLSHEQQRKRGRYHRIEGSNLAIERGEWIIGTKHSKEHSDFLADLNSGKYTGIDLAANLEFARSLSKRSRAIRSGSDGQMVRDIMRRASGYDELKSEMRGIRSAVEAVQSEIKRKPTVIPSGRNQIIIEDGLHQSSRIVEIK
jgi:hypothetical protein